MSSCLDQHQAKQRIVKRGACASVEMSQVDSATVFSELTGGVSRDPAWL